MASLGNNFTVSKKVFTADEVMAFLTSENEDKSDLDGESELLEIASPQNSITAAAEQLRSCFDAPLDDLSFIQDVEVNEVDTSFQNEYQGATEETSVVQHQPDESNCVPLSLSDSESEGSDRAGFYDSSDSTEDISSSSSASSDDSVSDVISESVYEVEHPTNSTSGSGCGRGLSRGRGRRLSRARGRELSTARGRGLSRGRRRGRGRVVRNQILSASSTSTSKDQLPCAAMDISVVDDQFVSAPAFNPNRIPGPHLSPNTDTSAISLFELV